MLLPRSISLNWPPQSAGLASCQNLLVVIFAAVFLVFSFTCAAAESPLAFPKGAAQVLPDASDEFFASTNVPLFEITVSGSELEALKKSAREYVKGTVRVDGSFLFQAVGIHLKGAAGSFRNLDDRPALTLNFDKYHRGQGFRGMDKIHLNNSVQDGSLMNESICRWMCLKAGVPIGRAGHARVRLNGRDLGLYVLIEGFDNTWLRRHFINPTGFLYDGGFCQELDGEKKLLSNKGPKGQPALKALWAAVQLPDEVARLEALEKTLDVDEYLRFAALELMTSHWDGYIMNRNNYRLYVDADTGKVSFFPSGLDQMFGDPNYNVFNPGNGVLNQRLVPHPKVKDRYRQTVQKLFEDVFKVEVLHARVDAMAAKLRPFGDYNGHANGLKDRLTARAAGLAKQIGVSDPSSLRFEPSGKAPLPTGWTVQTDSGTPSHANADAHGHKTLHIKAGGQTVASWRRRVLLDAGKYDFTARVRTARVAKSNEAFAGVGVRISGATRAQKLEGDNDWRWVSFPIQIDSAREVILVCELRASDGEAWFDVNSLALIRK